MRTIDMIGGERVSGPTRIGTVRKPYFRRFPAEEA